MNHVFMLTSVFLPQQRILSIEIVRARLIIKLFRYSQIIREYLLGSEQTKMSVWYETLFRARQERSLGNKRMRGLEIMEQAKSIIISPFLPPLPLRPASLQSTYKRLSHSHIIILPSFSIPVEFLTEAGDREREN